MNSAVSMPTSQSQWSWLSSNDKMPTRVDKGFGKNRLSKRKRSMTMTHIRIALLITLSVLLAPRMNGAHAEGVPASTLAGSWIVDAGPGQIKTITSYTPIGGGKFSAV